MAVKWSLNKLGSSHLPKEHEIQVCFAWLAEVYLKSAEMLFYVGCARDLWYKLDIFYN